MKAVLLEHVGGVEQLQIKEIAQPSIQPGEVLVKVKALSVNPVDYKVRRNEEVLTMIYGQKRPVILGWDIAGTVSAVGAEVTDYKVGDRVFGMVNFLGAGDAYAEYVAAPADHLAHIPANVSFRDAAATTLAALTALQVLKANIKAGDRALIHAGSGGVGHFAIQIAKLLGAHVISTSSAKNKDFILRLGADEHVDYRTQEFQEILTDIDFVFDMLNGETLYNSVKVVKPSGKIVSIPSPEFEDHTVKLAEEKGVDLSFLMVSSNGPDINTLAELLESGKIKPHISMTYQLDQIQDAHLQLESGRTIGKVIVTL